MNSHRPQKPAPSAVPGGPPLHLRTFGRVALTGADGDALGSAARQRRLLALLAVLATAPRGMSRDRLLLLLWPDRAPDKARHALTQSLYHARRALACDDLFISGTDIALNPARVWCDVAEWERAVSDERWNDAAALYAGPFLDDFALGVGEFERWQSLQRDRMARAMAEIFERLAGEAAGAGDAAAVVRWRRRRLELDTLNTSAASALVVAMVAAGDRIGALREATEHERRLREELEVDPDDSFVQLVHDLRASGAIPVERPNLALPAPPQLPAPRSMPRNGRMRWVGTAAALLAVALVAVGVRSINARSVELGQRILVAPFRVSAANPELGYLREGMVELLSTRFGDRFAPQAVDPGAVLKAWRDAGVLTADHAARQQVLRVARRLGAETIVQGAVVGTRERLVVTATLLAADGGRERSVTVEGSADSLSAVVDRLASRLMIADAQEEERFEARFTPSVPALLAYLDGQSAYRQGNYMAAVRLFERALAIDSTFALAAMRLALASDRVNVLEQHDRALALAWKHRDALNDRDRLHLTAFAGPRYPLPSSEAEQLAAWEAAAAIAPDRAETWLELGERFMRSGRLLGVPDHQQRAARAFSRASELDPEDRVARRLAALMAARLGGRATAVTRVSPAQDDDALRTAALAGQYDAVGIPEAERALRLWAARQRLPAERLDALLAMHSQALIQGRPVLALDFTEQMEELQPGSHVHLRLRVLDALYGEGDSLAAAAAASVLERSALAQPESDRARARQLANLCVTAQWRLQLGDLASAKKAVTRLRAAGMPRTPVVAGANPYTCAELLDAALVVRVSSEAGRRSLVRLDSLMLSGPAAGDASAYAHLWIARMWSSIGEPGRALEAIRRRPYLAGWPRYLATTRREEGRLALITGDREAASRMYRDYLAWRAIPEPSRRPEVDAVRAAEAALH